MKNNIWFIGFFVCLLFSFNFGFCQELPKLKSGESLRDVLMAKGGYRWLSGYSIADFKINELGGIDSVTVTSKYYSSSSEENLDLSYVKLIESLEFEPRVKGVWVQCKIYIDFHSRRTPDPENPSKPDRMILFKYGFDELWKNEIKTFFTDVKGGLKECIILNDKITVAPVYMNITT